MSYFSHVAHSSDLHSDGTLAVHPTLPYVFSTYHGEMKVWDWDKDWECIQTFKQEDPPSISHLAFSRQNCNTFATTGSSYHPTIQV